MWYIEDMTYDPQSIQEEDKTRAWVWYKEHHTHVDRMIAESGSAYPPCGSDCIRPELWKPEHWKWLLDPKNNPSRSRTLVRVVGFNHSKPPTICFIVLPGWDAARQHVPISQDQVPEDIWKLFKLDKRCHARVNIDADIADLVFSDWEPE